MPVAFQEKRKTGCGFKISLKNRIGLWIGKKLLGVEQYRYSISVPHREVINGKGLFMDDQTQTAIQSLLNSEGPTFSIFKKI